MRWKNKRSEECGGLIGMTKIHILKTFSNVRWMAETGVVGPVEMR